MRTMYSLLQVLKLYAWEVSFQDKVNNVRLKELNTIKRLAYLQSVNSFFWTTAPVLVIYYILWTSLSQIWALSFSSVTNQSDNNQLYIINKCPTYCGKRSHRRLVIPCGCKWICLILTHVIHGCLDPHKSAPKRHLDQFSRFFSEVTLCPTHRHTDRATCDICSNGPHLMHCVQATRPKTWTQYNTVGQWFTEHLCYSSIRDECILNSKLIYSSLFTIR